MVRTLIAVLGLGCLCTRASTGHSPEDPIDRAEKDFATALSKASGAFDDAMSHAAEPVVKALDAAMKAATTRGDLDAAIQLREKRRRYASFMVRRNLAAPIPGVYFADSEAWGSQDMLLRKDGTFGRPGLGEDHKVEGTWGIDGRTLSLRWTDWPVEQVETVPAFKGPTLKLYWKSSLPED